MELAQLLLAACGETDALVRALTIAFGIFTVVLGGGLIWIFLLGPWHSDHDCWIAVYKPPWYCPVCQVLGNRRNWGGGKTVK